MIESNHAPPSLRPRGVYALDFLSAEGHSYIVAVSSAGRNVLWSAVPPGCDYAGTWDRITRQLDEVDPVDVLHGARPLRLMRGVAVTSPAVALLACRGTSRPPSH